MIKIVNTCFGETALPNGCGKSEFFSGAESEPAFDELNGAFDAHPRIDGDERMEVVGHDNKGVKKIFPLSTVIVEDLDEQSSRTFRLQQIALHSNGGRYEERSLMDRDIGWIGMSEWNRHRQRLKPGFSFLEFLRHV